jgi:hypothetical protein
MDITFWIGYGAAVIIGTMTWLFYRTKADKAHKARKAEFANKLTNQLQSHENNQRESWERDIYDETDPLWEAMEELEELADLDVSVYIDNEPMTNEQFDALDQEVNTRNADVAMVDDPPPTSWPVSPPTMAEVLQHIETEDRESTSSDNRSSPSYNSSSSYSSSPSYESSSSDSGGDD